MNAAIEMHDSTCLALESNQLGYGFVLLDAYVHRTEGEPGRSPGIGGVQRIRMTVEGMTVEGVRGELPAEIYEGSLAIDELLQENMIPFPACYAGAIRFSMLLSDDARMVSVCGTSLSLHPEGDFRFVEDVDGAWH